MRRNSQKVQFLTGFLILICLMAACQPDDAVLPTVADVNAISTDTAATATADVMMRQQSITPTATALPTEVPSETPVPSATDTPNIPTPTPIGFNARGTLYYIYNGDAIARVNGDGTASEIIVTSGVGQRLSDLTLSPDGQLLAYIAPGSGSAREVFVSSLDGTYTQQVSCLGFAEVREIVWTPDGAALAFFAAELPTTAGNIYIANVEGSGNCPTENNQRVLYPAQTTDLRDIVFNQDASLLLYAGAGEDILAYEMNGEAQAAELFTYASAYGADRALAQQPGGSQFAYINTVYDEDTGVYSGGLVLLGDSSAIPSEPFTRRGQTLNINAIRWSPQGTYLLAIGEEYLYYIASSLSFVNESPLPLVPEGAFSFDETEIAFVIPDAEGVQQIFAYALETGAIRQITFNPEGTIEDIVWVASPGETE